MTSDDNNLPQSDAARVTEPTPTPERPRPRPATSITPGYLGPIDPLLPEDLRVPWGWGDLALLIAVAISGTFVVSLLLIKGFTIAGISFRQVQNIPGDRNLFLILNQALLSVALLAYLAAQMRHSFHVPFWRTIGWRPLQTGQTPRAAAYLGLIFSGCMLAILVTLSSAAFKSTTKMPIEQFFQDRRSALLLMSLGVLLAPVLEETIFRGYLYPVVARSFGVNAGIVVTGTLFGLLHASQLWGGWAQIALLVVVGIVFTYARARTHTVVASYLLHVSYNSFLFLGFLVASHGFRHFPAAQ
jgi:membrane protease YdiL (CAAX protease family)